MNQILVFVVTFGGVLLAMLLANRETPAVHSPSSIYLALASTTTDVHPIMQPYVEKGRVTKDVSKGASLFTLDMEKGGACFTSHTDVPWKAPMREHSWIVKKYIQGYSEASGLDPWTMSSAADMEVLLQILDSHDQPLLQHVLKEMDSTLFARVVDLAGGRYVLKGYPPVLSHYYNNVDQMADQIWDVVKTMQLYMTFPFNVTRKRVHEIFPALLARGVNWKGGRALCLPLMLLRQSMNANVGITVSGGKLHVSTLRNIRQGEVFSFNFAAWNAGNVIQKSTFVFGGSCVDDEGHEVEVHIEPPQSELASRSGCLNQPLSLTFDGSVRNPDLLLRCILLAAMRGSEDASTVDMLLQDRATTYDLWTFLKNWTAQLLETNYTAAPKGLPTPSTMPTYDSTIKCVLRRCIAALKGSDSYIDRELANIESMVGDDPELTRQRRDKLVGDKSMLDKVLYDYLGEEVISRAQNMKRNKQKQV